MDKKTLLKSLPKSSMPYLTAIILASLVTAIASWAQTTNIFYSYDASNQLTRARFTNRTSFSNRTAMQSYVYDSMGNRLIKLTSMSSIGTGSPSAFNYTSPLNNTTGIDPTNMRALTWQSGIGGLPVT